MPDLKNLSRRTFIVTPVGPACNIRCGYCYHAAISPTKLQVMPDSVLERVIGSSIKTANDILYIWHGGEPLLAGRDFYDKVVALQRKYRRSGQRIKNGIQTNGTLLNRGWAIFFAQNSFSVSISLDGNEWLHNLHRKKADGSPSYNEVLAGIQSLVEHNPETRVGVIVVVNKDNVKHPDLVYNTLAKAKWSLGMELNTCTPTTAGHDLSPSTEDLLRFWKRCFDTWWEDDNPQIHIRFFKDVIRAILGRMPLSCARRRFGCRYLMAIDENGSVYTCSRFLKEPSACLGNVSSTGIDEVIVSRHAQEVYEREFQLPTECDGCEWLMACGGGCPYVRWLRGGFEIKHFECEARKEFFDYVKRRIYEAK